MGYLAPEQLHGKPIGGDADVYALGMIARELGADAHSELPPMFIALVDRMLATDPGQRPTSAEVREATAWLCSQHGAQPYTFTPPVTRSRVPRTSELADAVSGEIVSARE